MRYPYSFFPVFHVELPSTLSFLIDSLPSPAIPIARYRMYKHKLRTLSFGEWPILYLVLLELGIWGGEFLPALQVLFKNALRSFLQLDLFMPSSWFFYCWSPQKITVQVRYT